MGKVLIQITDTEGPLAWSGPPPAGPDQALALLAPDLPLDHVTPNLAPAAANDDDLRVKAVFFARRGCSYVITGGLGGFGLALAAWLVTKGAGHIVLTSKRCVSGPS